MTASPFFSGPLAACLFILSLGGCASTPPNGSGGGTTTGTTTTTTTGSTTSTTTTPGTPGTVRVYVAGESIERRNRFVEAPFTGGGALNDRGGGDARNDREEYGWSVPLADRLRLRDPSLTIVFVGADTWLDADDNPYDGTYPSTQPGATSAISGTDIQSWLDQRQAELTAKTHCYDVAFAARGGNDFGNEDDADYKTRLKSLVLALAAGSSCRADPIIYVTGHMPDDQRGGSKDPPDTTYIAQQKHRFVERAQTAVSELAAESPQIRAHFIDLYTPFLQNKPTAAFPSEVWSTNGILDFAKITRPEDLYHPRRLASIFAGENAADAIDLVELHTVAK